MLFLLFEKSGLTSYLDEITQVCLPFLLQFNVVTKGSAITEV